MAPGNAFTSQIVKLFALPLAGAEGTIYINSKRKKESNLGI
jgi:hypothetical protein